MHPSSASQLWRLEDPDQLALADELNCSGEQVLRSETFPEAGEERRELVRIADHGSVHDGHVLVRVLRPKLIAMRVKPVAIRALAADFGPHLAQALGRKRSLHAHVLLSAERPYHGLGHLRASLPESTRSLRLNLLPL